VNSEKVPVLLLPNCTPFFNQDKSHLSPVRSTWRLFVSTHTVSWPVESCSYRRSGHWSNRQHLSLARPAGRFFYSSGWLERNFGRYSVYPKYCIVKKYGWLPTFSAETRLKYCAYDATLEKNRHCQSTIVTNKADLSVLQSVHSTRGPLLVLRNNRFLLHRKFTTYAKLNLWLSCVKQTRQPNFFSADENLAADTANGAGLGVCPLLLL